MYYNTNMKEKSIRIGIVKKKYESINMWLNEKSRRIWSASEAESLGYGGLTIVREATGIDLHTIRKGISELEEKKESDTVRIRRKGGGRKKLTAKQPEILTAIKTMVDSSTGGDPESPLLWTCRSSYNIADELKKQGYEICQKSVHAILTDELGYSLQANRKTEAEREQHPDRNAQFEYIVEKTESFLHENCAVLSVDTKKKENIGNYKNNGREYSEKGMPVGVNMHDFTDKNLGKAAPYGVYDIGSNKGWVSVGISNDTAEFAVNTVRAWWYNMGESLYKNSEKIFITADSGGSNGYRIRLWKTELQRLADEINREIYVSHFPPGTSKWNKIEHRMFSYISQNWRGRPLISRETVVNLISNTETDKGLKIMAMLDENIYQTGRKISDKELAEVDLRKEDFHGEWNYMISPHHRR